MKTDQEILSYYKKSRSMPEGYDELIKKSHGFYLYSFSYRLNELSEEMKKSYIGIAKKIINTIF